MNKYNQNKPSEKLVNDVIKKIEKYLVAHDIKIKIELFSNPIRLENYIDGKHTGTSYYWIRKCIIKSSILDDIDLEPYKIEIYDGITDKEIWNLAYTIQQYLYNKLNIKPDINRINEPYWNLWRVYPK